MVCFFCSMAVVAQNDSEYEERIEQYQKDWSKLIPRYTKVQYAGSMGLFSLGTGWVYGKNNQWETDLMFGYIPKYSTEHGKLCITLKENFTPWDLIIGQKGFSFQPLSCGIYVNSVIDDDFWVSEPGKYPNAYYTFSTKIRFNFFVGQRIAFKIPKAKRDWAKSLALFYEISSNELYIVSAANNHYLKPSNYLHLSLGIKIQWF
ncbi:MAG: hypothetical protein LBR81_06650 [Prevotellaceae bacterium]|nr:hypothetical protein [Prevotellaceae bacterium]